VFVSPILAYLATQEGKWMGVVFAGILALFAICSGQLAYRRIVAAFRRAQILDTAVSNE